MRLLFAALLLTFAALAQQSPFPSATPASLGLDPAILATLDADIISGKFNNVDSLLILRHGKIAFDRTYPRDYAKIYAEPAQRTSALNPHDFGGPYNYFNPFWHPYYRGSGNLHTLQSVTKTITSAVIGVATTQGIFPSLDTPLLKFFDPAKVANLDDRKRRITLRHVLTMTAGFDWNEGLPYSDPNNTGSAMEASFDWVKYTIDRPMGDEPGTRFNYNSGATELLAHVFRQATGQDIEEYAAKNLFAPLGIADYYWKRIPTGLADTEGGLYLDRRDLAKIMLLFHRQGIWQGKQIVSQEWVKASVTPAATVRGTTKYGYKWWLYPYAKDDPRYAFGGSGFGGQLPLVLPDLDIVVVVNQWNILGGKSLGPGEIITRMIAAVTTSSPH